MAEDWDQLVRELKALRLKRGLTLHGLARSPRVLAAMNNPPLQEAYDQLAQRVNDLGDDERSQALRNAYALGMREPGLLTARREDLHTLTGRDAKTIAKYEVEMIEELASRLLGAVKQEVSDSTVVVVGRLNGDHLAEVTVTVRLPTGADGDATERAVEYRNTSENHSLTALLYQLPHDWRPLHLTLALIPSDTTPPMRFWAAPAKELLDLMFASHGGEMPLNEGCAIIEVDQPRQGIIYAIYWTPG